MGDRGGTKGIVGGNGKPDNTTIVPQLFDQMFPHWSRRGRVRRRGDRALVPAAIMSIAAANLFTRNIWLEYVDRSASPARQAAVSKIASLVVKDRRRARHPADQPAVLHRPAAHRRRHHLQTLPAVGSRSTPLVPPLGPVRRLARRHGLGMWCSTTSPTPHAHKHFGGSNFPIANWFDPGSIGLDPKATCTSASSP